jgi:4-amino-4-deoxy-L-arabinose transferase-like glycosyltransferase
MSVALRSPLGRRTPAALRFGPPAGSIAILAVLLLYFYGLTGTGLLGPDEPRYAAVGREMARSGDWVTPRLWGVQWFEKPALLYWMTATAFRLGAPADLAPRLPVALLSIVFLMFYQRLLSREFGTRRAWFATVILASCAGWIGYSQIGVTDMPMAAAFSAAMLLSLMWVRGGNRRVLMPAAALLGLAVLAKGLVPLVLAAPLAWMGRKRIADLLCPAMVASFLAVALPWYLLCYARNGYRFIEVFFVEHQFGRFASEALGHPQPFWFYVPVVLAALFPWTPGAILLFRKRLYHDAGTRFLLGWIVFGLVFFSLSENKLPGYILPLLPALAGLVGYALGSDDERGPDRAGRFVLAAGALCLMLVPAISAILPQALARGISRATWPRFEVWWMLPVLLAAAIRILDSRRKRVLAVGLLFFGTVMAGLFIKVRAYPRIDAAASARPLWRAIAPHRNETCIGDVHRAWRYGLNYYSVEPLPDCESLRQARYRVEQEPDSPPQIKSVR